MKGRCRLPRLNAGKSLKYLLVAVVIAIASVCVSSSFSLTQKAYAGDTSTNVEARDLAYSLDGVYEINPVQFRSTAIDVVGGMRDANSTSLSSKNSGIQLHDAHHGSNQRFYFNAVDTTKTAYIYALRTSYRLDYVLDITNGSGEKGAVLQLCQNNDTKAQRFIVREVYIKSSYDYRFVGYAIFTGSSDYNMCLMKYENKIVQYPFDYNSINYNQVWNLSRQFTGWAYNAPGYIDSKKTFGSYNAVPTQQKKGRYNNGYYESAAAWEKSEDFLIPQIYVTGTQQTPRMTQDGYTFFNPITLNVSYKDKRFEGYTLDKDNSNYVDGKYINTGDVVGYGCVEIEHIDENGSSYSEFITNALKGTNYLPLGTGQFRKFEQPGKYNVRVYYKVYSPNWYVQLISKERTYVMKEFSFSIASPSTTCSAIKLGETDKTLASYTLTTQNDQLKINYDGDQKYRAADDDVIEFFLLNASGQSGSEIGKILSSGSKISAENLTKAKAELVKLVKTFNEFKIYFTNTAFYLSSANNKFVLIQESMTGYNSGTSNYYYNKTPSYVTDGSYEYQTFNPYVYSKKNYYKVFVQCQPNKQVFRNATYCYQSETEGYVNYAIDYAFLEDVKIFPNTLTVSMSYQNVTNGVNENTKTVDYKSNTIIYNTTNNILKLQFSIVDASGNTTKILLYLYPPIAPQLNEKRLEAASLDYNYISNGYLVYLYSADDRANHPYLFSTEQVAIENLLNNIILTPDLCKQQDDGSYIVTYYRMSPTELHFNNNAELVEYIYEYAKTQIEYKTIYPGLYDLFRVTEKSMHTDSLYLSKDFSLTTDEHFPLFESYKTYFNYYSNSGKELKSGIITYNGEYKYGETMFKILADENEANWVDGYVVFTEYNISANKGNTYTAKIVNGKPSIRVKYRSGAILNDKTYNASEFIDCEEFQLPEAISEDAFVKVSYNPEKYSLGDYEQLALYNHFTFEKCKFTKPGTYKIELMNTHGFGYTLYMIVEGLAASFNGVDNFGTTSSAVTFTTTSRNFTCFINGKEQTLTPSSTEEDKYIYTFNPTNEDQNIVVIKDTLQFAFVLKGTEEYSTAPYYALEQKYNAPLSIRKYKAQCRDNITKLLSYLQEMEAYNANAAKLVGAFKAVDIEFGQYDINIKALNDIKERIDELKAFLQTLNDSDNELLKLNANYLKKDILASYIADLEQIYNTKESELKDYAVAYFNAQDIDISRQEVYSKLIGKSEAEIKKLYKTYTTERDENNKTIKDLKTMKHNLQTARGEIKSLDKEADYIANNYKWADEVQQYQALISKIQTTEKAYKQYIKKYRTDIINIKLKASENPFIEYLMADDIKQAKAEVEAMLTENCLDSLTDLNLKIKQNILRNLNDITNRDYLKNVDSQRQQYQDRIDLLNNEKEWWKIFSNIGRDNEIKATKELLNNLKQTAKSKFNETSDACVEFAQELSKISILSPNMVDDIWFTKLTDFINYGSEIFKKF